MSHDWFNNVYQSTGKSAHDIMGQIELMLEALKSSFIGAGYPSDPVAGMWCLNTTDHCVYVRNEANDAWVQVFNLNTFVSVLPPAAGAVLTAMMADGAVTEPKLATGAVTETKLGAGAVNRTALKTDATGAVTGTLNASEINIELQDYCCAPSIWGESNYWTMEPYQTASDPNDTTARFRLAMAQALDRDYAVRYRYVTATDRPFVYAVRDADGNIRQVWAAGDPPSKYWGFDAPPEDFVPPIQTFDLPTKKIKTPDDEAILFDYDCEEYHGMIDRSIVDRKLLHKMLSDEYELMAGKRIFTRKNLSMI